MFHGNNFPNCGTDTWKSLVSIKLLIRQMKMQWPRPAKAAILHWAFWVINIHFNLHNIQCTRKEKDRQKRTEMYTETQKNIYKQFIDYMQVWSCCRKQCPEVVNKIKTSPWSQNQRQHQMQFGILNETKNTTLKMNLPGGFCSASCYQQIQIQQLKYKNVHKYKYVHTVCR